MGSLSGVLVGAIAAAPLKAANIIPMLGDMPGLQSSRTKHIEPIVMEFAPGESQLNDAQQEHLRRLIDQMRRDSSLAVTVQHTLGQGDVEIDEQRTNPLAGDSMSIAIELRPAYRYQLQEQLISLNGQIRAAMASQNSIAVSTGVDSLRLVATELKETEDALDQALDLLRPGADRHGHQRRTRTGAILLGELRLAAIQDVLLHSALPSAPDRIRKAGVLFNPADTDASGKVTLRPDQAKQKMMLPSIAPASSAAPLPPGSYNTARIRSDCGMQSSCYTCFRTYRNQFDLQFLSSEAPLPWLATLCA